MSFELTLLHHALSLDAERGKNLDVSSESEMAGDDFDQEPNRPDFAVSFDDRAELQVAGPSWKKES